MLALPSKWRRRTAASLHGSERGSCAEGVQGTGVVGSIGDGGLVAEEEILPPVIDVAGAHYAHHPHHAPPL